MDFLIHRSNAYRHGKSELGILVKTLHEQGEEPTVEPFIPEILALLDKFGKSGQSGGSAPYTAYAIAETIKKLCLFKPLSDLLGTDDEWIDIDMQDGSGLIAQNKRDGRLLKHEDGKIYFTDAILFVNKDGDRGWFRGIHRKDGSKLSSMQVVKSFPFRPMTFNIDIDEIEIDDHVLELRVRDESQLKKVFEYYDLLEP